MIEQPPFLTDEEADRVWRQSNDSLFGRTSPTTIELEQQILNLQRVLNERKKNAQPSPQSHDTNLPGTIQDQQSPITHSLESRVLRKDKSTNMSDKIPQRTTTN